MPICFVLVYKLLFRLVLQDPFCCSYISNTVVAKELQKHLLKLQKVSRPGLELIMTRNGDVISFQAMSTKQDPIKI
jgi:hypothetical protein